MVHVYRPASIHADRTTERSRRPGSLDSLLQPLDFLGKSNPWAKAIKIQRASEGPSVRDRQRAAARLRWTSVLSCPQAAAMS